MNYKRYRLQSLIPILIILLGSEIVLSQPDTTWTKTFGGIEMDRGYSVQQTSDGGYIITGATSNFGSGGTDVWLIKTDASGTESWNKTFGGTSYETGRSVKQTSDGGYVIVATTDSYGNGKLDYWLIKTDSEGNEEWNKTFGGTDNDELPSVQQTADGGYALVGATRSYGSGGQDVWLIKTDASGTELWNKTLGGTDDEIGHAFQQTTDGGYIITGAIQYSENNKYDALLIKTDSNGAELWSKTFGGSERDYTFAVQQTTDGGFIISGLTRSFGNGQNLVNKDANDVWLIKTDASGIELWSKTFGGSKSDYAYAVQQTIDLGYIIVGSTWSFGNGRINLWLIKTDSNGTELWNKTFGGSEYDKGRSVQQTSDGGYIIVGTTSSYGNGSDDIWLIKLNGKTLKVPSAYSTIQAAIDAATTGDTVLVADGTYTENLIIDKDITIISENGAEKTIIDGGKITHVIAISSSTTRDCVLDGFTVTNGGNANGDSDDGAGGINVWGGSPTLRNLIITGNRREKWSGGGIHVNNNGNPLVEGCTIKENYAEDGGGGIDVWRASIKIKDTILENNSAKYTGAMSIGTDDTLDFRPIIDIENVEVINQRDLTIEQMVAFSECSLTLKNVSFSNIRTESSLGSFYNSYVNIENLSLKDIRDNGHSLLFSGSKGTVSGLTIERDTSRWAIAKIENGSKIDFNNLKMSNSKTSDFSGLFIDDATVTIDTLDINNCNWEAHSIRVNKSIFTLSNGNFSSIVSEDGNAGIDASESSSVEISNTTIDSSSSGGHAMNFNGVKKVSITNSLFNGNHSQFSGGVIFAREIDSLLIENSSFVADTSGGEGGAIQLSSKNKFVRILKSTFSNNLSNSAGAINSWNTDSLFIDNSTFDGNVSSSSGAVSINADGTISAYFEIKNSDFIDNKAGTLGGALWIGNSEGYIQNVGIFNNESVDNFGGGIYISENVELTMNAVTISGNSSPEPAGEGIAIDGGNIIIKNSIIWDNHIQKNSGSIDITYSNIEGGFTGTGNIDANPIFCDTINYLIRDTSPCVGTGENGSNMGARGIGCYRPTSFDWVSTALDTINITQSNLADTYTLQWSASTDVDGDSINYLLYAQIGVYPAEEISDTTSLSVPITYQEILEGVFEGRPVNGATVRFNVKATDGIDTVDVTGDNRVIYVNRYEYLSTEGEGVPVEFALHENYPNPFNPTTTLRFDLPEVSDITLTIYNMLGQKVRTFDYQNTSAGYHSVKWNATNDYGDPVGAGVYLYQLQTKDFVKTRKMVLLK